MTIELHAVGAADGPALHAVLGDPEVARWLRPAGRSEAFDEDECARMAERYAAHWRAHGFGMWLARDGGEVVGRGGAGHTLAPGRAEVEVGWAVASSHRGRGVGTLLGRAGMEAAAERGIDGVVAFTRVDNLASRRVMEKLGLRLERAFTHAGLPHVLYRNSRPIR